MKCLALIPARYASVRFPGKPLVDIDGKSMIRRVYEQASLATKVDKVIVATDDERILQHVAQFGGNVVMTKPNHQSGTDRCAEVAMQFPEFDLIVNVQGDEPFIRPEEIDRLLQFLGDSTAYQMATLVKKIEDSSSLFNPNVVKCVFGQRGNALYFSRQPVPHQRGLEEKDWLKKGNHYKHIGMYAFKMETLLEIASLPPGRLETAESLEQLRWLENGFPIGVVITSLDSFGIDTPEDLARINTFIGG